MTGSSSQGGGSPYESFYVNLRRLRHQLHRLSQNKHNGSVADASFSELMADELHKVNQFSEIKFQELQVEMQNHARALKQFVRICNGELFKRVARDSDTPAIPGDTTTNGTFAQDSPLAGDDDGVPVTVENVGGVVSRKVRQVVTLSEVEKKVFLQDYEALIDETSAEVVHLHKYIRINYNYLVRAVLLYDKVVGRSASPWFIARLVQQPFAAVDVDKLMIMLSLCWEKFRGAETAAAGSAEMEKKGPWKPPESFVRNTTKYWVRPENVPVAKACIIRHVPYLIFGYSSQELEYLIDPLNPTTRRADTAPTEGQLVSSVYLDSEDGVCYDDRIHRYEGAELLRCRWYGENEGEPMKEIYVERKTHHEGWSGESSTKERFSLPQKRIFQFLKGQVDIEAWANYLAKQRKAGREDKKIRNLLRLGHEISDTIQKKSLQPMLRTSYLRSAFQASDNNDVRFSLDVNLCMVDEFQPNNHPNHPWCRVSEEVLGKNEVVRFPFAVLEVKLQAEQPSWVTEMLEGCKAVMVYKFSKFQHGMAFLHRDKVGIYGLPHWIPDFECKGFVQGFSIPHSQAEDTAMASCMLISKREIGGLDSIQEHSTPQSAIAYNLVLRKGSPNKRARILSTFYPGTAVDATAAWQRESPVMSPETLLEAIHSRAKTVQRLDPKSILASERTMLHYVMKSLYVIAVALALLEFRGLKWAAISMLSLGLISIIYVYIVHVHRTQAILNRRTKQLERDRIENLWAPSVATGMVVFALVVGLLTNLFSQYAESHTVISPFSNKGSAMMPHHTTPVSSA